jgi:hypothetical protein
MPAKKTSQSTATKVKASSVKAVKTPAKKIAKPAKKDTPKSAVVTPTKVKKAATRSTAVSKSSTPAPTPAPEAEVPHIPREEIQLRAYFISERRQTMGWPGNSSTDWIEAESQLVAEAKRRLKKTL